MLSSLLSMLHSCAIRRICYATTFFIALTLSLNSNCFAQSKADSSAFANSNAKFELGIAGGLSVNQFTDGQPQTGSNTGLVVGLSLDYKIYKQWSLQVEANFLQQGGQLLTFKDDTRLGLPESFATKNVRNSSVHLNSLDIPLLIKYTVPLQKDWVPQFYAGGSYAYNFNVTDNYQKSGNLLPGEDVIATVSDSENVSRYYRKDRMNLIVGADLHLELFSNLKLLLDFRYVSGVSPARKHYSYMEKVGFGSDIRSNSFISRIGLILPIQ